MFAPVFHPAMGHATPVRRELRVPTVFNFLGPLTNPARPFAQVLGVSDPHMLPLMAEVLARRRVRARLFRGDDGLDELTITGPSTVYDVADGSIGTTRFTPGDVGIPTASPEDLKGGDVDTAVAIARSILAGEPGPRRDVVLVNAAAAIEVAGRAGSVAEGLEIAARSIDSGAADATLHRWAAVSRTG
jgi:anthranilate phosphoribosyltransferase